MGNSVFDTRHSFAARCNVPVGAEGEVGLGMVKLQIVNGLAWSSVWKFNSGTAV